MLHRFTRFCNKLRYNEAYQIKLKDLKTHREHLVASTQYMSALKYMPWRLASHGKSLMQTRFIKRQRSKIDAKVVADWLE